MPNKNPIPPLKLPNQELTFSSSLFLYHISLTKPMNLKAVVYKLPPLFSLFCTLFLTIQKKKKKENKLTTNSIIFDGFVYSNGLNKESNLTTVIFQIDPS